MAYMVEQTWTQLQTVLRQSLSPQPSNTVVNATSPKIFQVVTSQARELETVNANEVS
jgi:hypothetical protein